MNKKYILTIAMISVMLALLLTACNTSNPLFGLRGSWSSGSGSFGLSGHRTFEDWVGLASDVVVAEFVTQRRFGYDASEFEFIVHERIFGDAADTIFVYTWDRETDWQRNEPQFTVGAHYLLLLETTLGVFSAMHDDGFRFLSDLMLDLNDPSGGTMHNEPLASHASGINFNSRNLTRERIISYVSTLPRDPIPQRLFIRSDNLEDIITDSPHVLIIEINEPWRLASEGFVSSLTLPNDIYNATVVEVLKGDWQVGGLVEVVVFADTVSPGETHIVSITPSSPVATSNSGFHRLSSRHSQHSWDQLNEIRQILGLSVASQVTFNLNGGQATEGNEAHFNPQTIPEGSTATQPESDPTRNGYTFAGWHTQAAGGVPFDFTMPITVDTVIYAQWVLLPLSHTVSFRPGYGSGEMEDALVQDGEPFRLPPHQFTPPEGYKFSHWWVSGYSNDAVSGNTFQPGDEIHVGGPVTVFAVWVVTTSPVEYPVFSLQAFNNGVINNASLASAGTIRIWTRLDGANAPVPISLAVTAIDQDGNNAMEFVRINEPWNNPGYVNMIDVNFNAPWQRIYFTATVFEQTVELVLVNPA